MPRNDEQYFDYLPVGETEFTWGLYVTGAGRGMVSPGGGYPPVDHPLLYAFDPALGRTLPEYQIIFISDGYGRFDSRATGPVEVRPGTLLLLFPDVWHTYRPDPKTGWHEYWVGMNGSYLHHLNRQELFSPDKAVLYPTECRQISALYERLIGEIRNRPNINQLRYGAIAMEILAWVVDQEQLESDLQSEGISGLVQQAVRRIWNWSHRRISVDDVAVSVGLNRRTLERYFRDHWERTVQEEIVLCRLTRARRLLDNTHMPVKQIAYAAGFSSPERMAKVFQRLLGVSPSDYRNTQQNG